MASVNVNDVHKDEDDEDLEKLRLAALMTLRRKPAVQPPSSSSVTFKPHFGNPNLIAIIPEGAEPVAHMRQKPYRAHPHPSQCRGGSYQQYRGPTSGSHSTLKVLPQVDRLPSIQDKVEESGNKEKEEVSTKFSRFEDTESESEDESENEEKKSNESSDESEDILALQDEDDSLEALMAQMEHEIESGIDLDHNKKEKKKSKNSKHSKGKEQKFKSDEKNLVSFEKQKSQTKTAIIEPNLKEPDCNLKQTSAKSILKEINNSPIKIHPNKINIPTGNVSVNRPSTPPAVQIPSDSNTIMPPQSPSNNRSLTSPPKSPPRETARTARKSRSPKDGLSSRIRTSPARLRSPRRLTPDKRSPLKTSPDHYYSGKNCTSPYYKSRERGYSNRSRSPIKRKSLSPKRTIRDMSPKHYQRRSRSPWSPGYRHSPESPRYRSPVRRSSLSPRFRSLKLGHSSHSPFYRKSPKRRTPSVSPRRSMSPMRKRDYSPHRRRPSPKRDYNQRRTPPLSPRRKLSPHTKKYSPSKSPRRMQRSLSPKRNISPRRRTSPMPLKDSRLKTEKRSRSPSLSLSPSSTRESKGTTRRNKSPLGSVRPKREADVNNRTWRGRRPYSPEKPVSGDLKEKRKVSSKSWEKGRENRLWDRRIVEEGRRERGDKTDRFPRKDKDTIRSDKEKMDEQKEEGNLKVSDNPLFEARRKKFESTALVEPASKKIRLFSKKSDPVDEKQNLDNNEESPTGDKKITEHCVQTEDDLFSGQEEVDDIDNFLNEDQEDVLDLSAEVWDSDEDLMPKANKIVTKKPASKKVKPSKKHLSANIKSPPKDKRRKVAAIGPSSPRQRSRSPSPEQKQEEVADRDDSDLRAELSRRREERLTKAGLLHEKLPRRLLQDAFESALGKKKIKKDVKIKKNRKEAKKKDCSPVHKEKSDGRRVLVLKRPAPVKMQSAHINVTFPSRDAESESDSSYSCSSSSEEERYAAAAPKRRLPVYMRLGTANATATATAKAAGRKVKLGSRRSQV